MNKEQHNRYIGYAFLAHAGFQTFWTVLFAAFFVFFFSSFPTPPGEPGPPVAFFGFFFAFMMIFQLVFTLPSAIAGYAVLKKKPWARIAAIIGAVMSAMNVPIGTAVCVYALWFFLGDEWKGIYEPTPQRRTERLPSSAYPADWERTEGSREEREDTVPRPGEWR